MNTHRIHRVAKLTGLSRDVIRIWERRYGLIKPARGPNRYRLYTDDDVALLRYVKAEMDKGSSIGDLAALGHDELLARMRTVPVLEAPGKGEPYGRLLNELVAALDPVDRATFERRLNGAVAVIPFEEALQGILLPLQERVGQLWHDGRISEAVEHYVTKQVQQKLFSVMNLLPVNEQGPKVVVACAPDEWHEIGAQSVAYHCRVRGCRVYYLGANVPVAALATFCDQVRPDLLILSLVVSRVDARAVRLAEELAESLGPLCPIAAGGKGAELMREHLAPRKVEVLDDFAALDRRLILLTATRTTAGK
ncbi:MAG: MerR family transcriptional regulator [Nitrospira sp.]|nr:MerR family transcriptional regulator [Nitrospira sp.]